MKNARLNSRSEQHDLEATSEAGLVTPSMFNENARSPSPAVQQSEKSAPSLIQSSTPCEAPNLNAK
jgi:hypothetical protein